MEFQGKWAIYYKQCLRTLESRAGFDESYTTLLERYVFVNMKLSDISERMYVAEATITHVNNKDKTNEASNPLMRVFVILNKESLALAKELQLTPASLKGKATVTKEKKGFNLDKPMRIAK